MLQSQGYGVNFKKSFLKPATELQHLRLLWGSIGITVSYTQGEGGQYYSPTVGHDHVGRLHGLSAALAAGHDVEHVHCHHIINADLSLI